MGFSIVKHRLVGDGVIRVDCVKNTQVIAGPDMIILHYTAGVLCHRLVIWQDRMWGLRLIW